MVEAEDSSSYEVLDIFDFEGNEYALLSVRPDGDTAGDERVVVMRLVEHGDAGSVLQEMTSDEEFERVVDYVNSLANQRDTD